LIRGIYIAASGMLAESVRQDIIANNLANATTTGFKRSDVVVEQFGEMLLSNLGEPGTPPVGSLSTGSQVNGVRVVDGQGKLRATDNPLDLALAGNGHFAIATPEGVRYTRDGSFALDAAGRLVTKDGSAVLGEGGPITLGPGEVKIAADGAVTQGGQTKGRLRITVLAPDSIRKEGDSHVNGTPQGGADVQVRQGFLEASTVNVVGEMVELIRVMRSFEANQRAARAHDEALQQSVTRVGSVG